MSKHHKAFWIGWLVGSFVGLGTILGFVKGATK
jgi:hypothetical protein